MNRGMCCTFNLDAAEEMFREMSFRESVSKLQKRDKSMSFDFDEITPSIENITKDPEQLRPQAGRSKGLSLIIDAHSDLVAQASVTDDVDGFFAVVDGKGQYPMTYR